MQTNTSTHLLTFLLILCSTSLIGQSFKATLTGHGQNPPLLTAGYGEIEADLKGDTLVVSGWFRNLGSDLAVNILGGAHIHSGYAGRNGSVAHALVLDVDSTLRSAQIDPAMNRFVLTAEQQAALAERALYINVHSEQYTGGELRGQLQPQADACYSTNLFGSNQLPMVMSTGSGALVLDLDGDTLTVSGSFSGLSSPLNVNAAGGMHLHGASAGSNGSIELFLNVDADTSGMSGILRADSNRFVLTVEQKEALAARLLYANVHSMEFGSGELRGQVVGQPLAVFRAYLAGTNQVPFVTSRADGQVIAELGADSSLVVSGSFSGVRSGVATQIAGGAHIHLGMAGMNGGIELFLNSELNVDSTGGAFAADSNRFEMDADQFQAMMRRGLYVNLHSNSVTSGEIRGQLLPESQIVFNGNLCSATAIPPVKSMAGGLIKGELTGNRLTLSGTLSGLGSDIDTNILGGAHIHLAAAGSTGGVAFPVNLALDGDLTRATLHARENVFVLEEDAMSALLARGAYINVHTQTYGSGEIRGQLLPESQAYFLASLAGSQQTNPVRSEAWGQVILELNRGGSVVATGSFNQLSSPLATNIAGGVHIHAGRSGGNGPVIQPLAVVTSGDQLSGTFSAADNRYMFSAGMLDTLMGFGHYVNVHSEANASGELRGQLLPVANVHLSATLQPMNAVQPITNNGATGAVTGIVIGNRLRLSGSFSGLTGEFNSNIAGGAHIHGARTGLNGGILVGLKSEIDPDLFGGIFPGDTTYVLEPAQADAVVSGNSYINIHTTAYGSGELRGQLVGAFNSFPEATSVITTPPNGSLVTVMAGNTDPFEVQWSGSDDRDSVAYILQVTADPTFSVIPLQVNTAGSRVLAGFTLADIDTLLAGLGVPVALPVAVFARVIASDGSLQSTGESASFIIRRDPVSSVRTLPDGWSFEVYPTVTNDQLSLRLVTPVQVDGELTCALVSASGQQVQLHQVGQPGGVYLHTFDVGSLNEGIWFVVLLENERVLATRKFVMQH